MDDHQEQEVRLKTPEFDELLLKLEAAQYKLVQAQQEYKEACRTVLAVTGHPGMAGTFNFDSVKVGLTYIVPQEEPKMMVRHLNLRKPGSTR